MAFSQTQLDAIEEAIASGSDSVSFDGKSVRYKSLDDMMRVRGILRRALGIDPSRSTTVLVAHDRGIPAAGAADDDLVSGV